MKHRLNIATTPLENNRPFGAAAGLIAAVALVALVVLVRAESASRNENIQLRSDISRLQNEIQANEARQQELAAYFKTSGAQQVLDRADFLNSLIAERSFPWTKIFMDLETTLPPGVRVVSITPKLVNDRAQLSMVVGATSDESKVQFLEAVEKSKKFSIASVQDERPSSQPGDADKVQITLDLWYQIT